MPPAVSRFGPQGLSGGPFSHLQQSHLHHQNPQHQPPGSGSLPHRPQFTPCFGQGNPNNVSPFAPSGNTNGLAGGFGTGGGLGAGGTGLASQAAVMGFAHGAALQQQQARDAMRRSSGGQGGGKHQMKGRIRDVWRHNLAQEMQILRTLIDKYPYISMDTEFPGIVARPMGSFTTKADYHYQTLRCNVDLLRVIQLGITLFSEEGDMPSAHPTDLPALNIPSYQNSLMPCPCTWQFNFQFSIEEDMYNSTSIEFLENAGLHLEEHKTNGIYPDEFGAALISSGLVLVDDVRWISFHSGYDFGYLVKLMLCKPLPESEAEYRKLLSVFFPSIYDIKFMVKHAQRSQSVNDCPLSPTASSILTSLGQKSGLQDLAEELSIKRIGTAHTAGSDSLLTGKVFWEVKRSIFNGTIDDEKYLGQVWGLNGAGSSLTTYTQSYNNQEEGTTPNLNGATIYHNSNTPSTPDMRYTAPAMNPNQPNQSNGQGIGGSLTPAGGGGVFGQFRYQKG